MEGISDRTLLSIAQDVGNHDNLSDLGLALDFRMSEIKNYQATNHTGGQVSSKGTQAMLFSWRERTSKRDQIRLLKEALSSRDVGLVTIAEDHLKTSAPPSMYGQAQGSRQSPKEVTQHQLQTLSSRFPNNQYTAFCCELGFDYNMAQARLMQHMNNSSAALMSILMEWKTATGGDRAKLEAAMRNANAGGLINQIF